MSRILVVDDTPDMRLLLVAVLQRANHEVVEASDGKDVDFWVRDTKPDVIILDLLMPEVDGWEALTQLKSDPELKEIPVIISSALSSPDDFARARLLGAIDYIPKPWTADDLLKRIEMAAHKYGEAV